MIDHHFGHRCIDTKLQRFVTVVQVSSRCRCNFVVVLHRRVSCRCCSRCCDAEGSSKRQLVQIYRCVIFYSCEYYYYKYAFHASLPPSLYIYFKTKHWSSPHIVVVHNGSENAFSAWIGGTVIGASYHILVTNIINTSSTPPTHPRSPPFILTKIISQISALLLLEIFWRWHFPVNREKFTGTSSFFVRNIMIIPCTLTHPPPRSYFYCYTNHYLSPCISVVENVSANFLWFFDKIREFLQFH